MSRFGNIEFQIDGAVATLTMNRPKKRNAFDVPMLMEMLEATQEIDRNDSIRVAILTGAGRSFSAGADLTAPLAPGRTVLDNLEEDYRPVLMSITHSPKPWISAVNGAAAGVGSAFAMNCDLTVMAEDAFLYQAFTAIGLIPDGGATWHLARTIGRKRAYELIVTGEKLMADRCLALGLCNRVVAADRLLEETTDWARELAAKAPLSLRYAKASLMTALESDLDTSYSREASLQQTCAESQDALEGVRAFSEKRSPVFVGR
ncbi:MAG: enoyl-CoA hydratase/isomerase family protein [Deltaproteobacteria bacterium]|nr:enoyl-CoA hydratase/isomerase family protein [Deltaproteobacteria bacterium]